MTNKYARQSKEAQKKRHKERSCENKKTYDTQEEAAQTGNSTYHCPYCKKWHTSGARQSFINSMLKRAKK
jgi:flagellum-specific peptidoglycan hydrolase FlgJ